MAVALYVYRNGVLTRLHPGASIGTTDPPESELSVSYQINAGGPAISGWTTQEGLLSTQSTVSTLHNDAVVVPSDIPQEIFLSEEGNPNGDRVEFTMPATAGQHLVRSLHAELYGGQPAPGRIYDIYVNDNLVAANVNMKADYGDDVGVAFEYEITTTGEPIAVSIRRAATSTGNPQICGIQVLSSVIAPPYFVEGTAGDGFAEITYKVPLGASFIEVYRNDALLNTTGPVGTFRDTTVTNGESYNYHVVAVGSDSSKSAASASISLSPSVIETADRLGVMATAPELAVYRLRLQKKDTHNFYASGDEYTNSPGDGQRIVNRKNAVLNKSVSDLTWLGPTHNYPNAIINSSSWPRDRTGQPPFRDSNGASEPLLGAAFWAAVMGTEAIPDPAITATARDEILTKIKTCLLRIARSEYLDFTNTQRWDVNKLGSGFHPVCQITHWLVRLGLTYDWSQIGNPTIWSTAEKTEFLSWMVSAGPWFLANVEKRRNESNDNGTANAAGQSPWGQSGAAIWGGGPKELVIHHKVDNHVPWIVSLHTFLVAICDLEESRSDLNIMSSARKTEYINLTKWQIRHYLISEVIAQAEGNGKGVRTGSGNFYRGIGDASPNDGWKYSLGWNAKVLFLVDTLARMGDDYGYTLSTTNGIGGSNGGVDTSGQIPNDSYFGNPGAKNMHRALQQMMRYILEGVPEAEPKRYGHLTSTDVTQRIDSIADPTGIKRSNEWESLFAQLRFRDPKITAIMDRSATGAPDHSSNPRVGQWAPYDGIMGYYPGANLMYMYVVEDHPDVWPYPE